MWYRPVRERPADMVVEAAARSLRATGCDEVSLISLSSCDYGGVREAIAGIRERFPHVRVSLPSLRVDSAAVVLAGLGAEQRGSVTLAPEAGTQARRDAINKRVDERDLAAAVEAVFRAGYSGLKLYFMVGLPDETDDDVAAIAALAAAALERAMAAAPGQGARSRSPSRRSCPRRTRAFERAGFAGESPDPPPPGAAAGRLPRQVRVRFHDVETSLVEATMAMGGREVAELIEAAWRGGARFDGWSESFDAGIWRRAAAELGIELGGPRWSADDDAALADRRSPGPRRLLARRGGARPPRRDDRRLPRRRLYVVRCLRRRDRPGPRAMSWWLLSFGRDGAARYISHLDTMRVVQRTFARAGIEIALSQGMRPKPRLSLPLPLPTGAAALDELAVVEVAEETQTADLADRLQALRRAAAEGFSFERVTLVEERPRPQAAAAVYQCRVRAPRAAVDQALSPSPPNPRSTWCAGRRKVVGRWS